MQAVGRRCERCEEKIRSAIEGAGCGDCGVAYHFDCLDEPEDCPECGVAFGARERAREGAEATELARSILNGRATVATSCVAIAVTHLAMNGFLLHAMGSDVEQSFVAKVLVRLGLLGLLLWMTFLGRRWARALLACLVLVSIALSAVVAGIGGGLVAMLLVMVCVDAVAVAMLFLPRGSRAYFADRQAVLRHLRQS